MYSRGVVIMVMVVVLVNMLMGGVYSRGGDYGDGGCIGKYTDGGGGDVYSRGGDYGDGGCIG